MLVAETVMHALPWYFGAAVFVGWAIAMTLVGALVLRRVRATGLRRAEARNRTRTGSRRPVGDDRSLAPGKDVEIW